jgi:hypothetical protein
MPRKTEYPEITSDLSQVTDNQVISEEKIKLRNAKDGQTMDNTQLNQMTFANEIKKCFLIGTFTF